MVLQFNEAPDYASILERDYEKQNRGFDRREQAERANDKRRIQNAGVPLDLILAGAQFSTQLKQLKDKLDKDKIENAEKAVWQSKDDLIVENKIKDLDKDEEVNFKIAGKIEREDGDSITATDIRRSTAKKSSGLSDSIRSIETDRSSLSELFIESPYYEEWKNEPDPSKAASILERWGRSVYHKHYEDGKVKYALLKQKLIPYIDRFKETKIIEKNKKYVERVKHYESVEDQTDLKNIFSSDNPGEGLYNWMITNQGRFGEKISDSVMATNQLALHLVETGQITTNQYHQFSDHKIPNHSKKGSPLESIKDIWQNAFVGSEQALSAAQKKALDARDLSQQNYGREFIDNLERKEAEQGSPLTDEQLKEEFDKWDLSKGGSFPVAELNNWYSAEKADDDELKRSLEYKWDKGIPFSKEEVKKLNDRDLENQWLQKVTETNPNVPPTEYTEDAHSLIDKYINGYTKETDGTKNKTAKWQNNEINAKRAYAKIYAQEIQTASSEYDAHKKTLDRVKANIEAGIYNELPNSDPNLEVNREVALIAASNAIALDENIVNTGLIYGSEQIVKEAALLPEGEVHLFYKQLANKFSNNEKSVNAHSLQYRQLEIAAELKGEGKPVKSKILQEYEKLEETTKQLLSRHTSPAKVQRAIIEEYGKDGDISYEDVGVLLDEVIADYPVKETVIEQSTKASMAPSPRTTTRPESEVALLDKPEVKEAIDILVDRAKSLLPEVFYGKETSQALMSDITKSLEKQKEIASKRRRRRGR